MAQRSQLHHYVPQWYQRRFLAPGQKTLFYLDLKPRYTSKNPRYWPPSKCFSVDDLYSLRFGGQMDDVLERVFFGKVDQRGASALTFYERYEVKDGIHDAHQNILTYIGAQRFRTPHGLDWVERHVASSKDRNQRLMAMRRVFGAYGAMWAEGIWEVIYARSSATKFIISDEPVTFFNRRIFPGEDQYPGGDDLPRTGTRTIFPLSAESCLIITHLQLVRNPWSRPLDIRENARLFGNTMANFTEMQFGRELEKQEVLRINYILKHRATKFIAAGQEQDLHPERWLGNIDWAKLDDDWFLLPNPWKVGFTTGIMAGRRDGTVFSIDEYGREPGHPRFEDEKRRDAEFATFEEGKREWAKRRLGRSVAQVIEQNPDNCIGDSMMRDFLQTEGLVPSDATGETDER